MASALVGPNDGRGARAAAARSWADGRVARPGGGTAPAALALILGVLVAAQAAFLLRMAASPVLGVGLCLLLVAGAALLSDDPGAALTRRRGGVPVCLGAAAALCVLGGQGHLLYAPPDWLIRDAVLGDLARGHWPVAYAHHALLRAPLGLYVLPATLALGDAGRAQALLLVQDVVLLAAIFAAFTGAQSPVARAVTLATFAAWSGWNLIGGLVLHPTAADAANGWRAIAADNWGRGLQYPSQVTALFWAPNHTLPAWMIVAGYAAWRRGACRASVLAGLAGLSLLWSPLACMGAAPLVLLALAVDLRRGRLRPRAVLALAAMAAACLPAAVYLTLDGGSVLHAWNFRTLEFQRYYPLFIALEVLPVLALASRAPSLRSRLGRCEVLLVAAMLVLIPFYKIGFANDFMLRASTAPLALTALWAAEGLRADAARKAPWLPVSLAALAIGAATPVMQGAIALAMPRSAPSSRDLPAAWAASPFSALSLSHYLVDEAAYRRWSWLLRSAPKA